MLPQGQSVVGYAGVESGRERKAHQLPDSHVDVDAFLLETQYAFNQCVVSAASIAFESGGCHGIRSGRILRGRIRWARFASAARAAAHRTGSYKEEKTG